MDRGDCFGLNFNFCTGAVTGGVQKCNPDPIRGRIVVVHFSFPWEIVALDDLSHGPDDIHLELNGDLSEDPRQHIVLLVPRTTFDQYELDVLGTVFGINPVVSPLIQLRHVEGGFIQCGIRNRFLSRDTNLHVGGIQTLGDVGIGIHRLVKPGRCPPSIEDIVVVISFRTGSLVVDPRGLFLIHQVHAVEFLQRTEDPRQIAV